MLCSMLYLRDLCVTAVVDLTYTNCVHCHIHVLVITKDWFSATMQDWFLATIFKTIESVTVGPLLCGSIQDLSIGIEMHVTFSVRAFITCLLRFLSDLFKYLEY